MHLFLLVSLLVGDHRAFDAESSLPEGKSALVVRFGDVPLTLFTYKPPGFRTGPLIMVFHGVLRNAEEYRDDAVEMGNRFGAIIVAPLFDEPTFPKPKYQYGGIIRDGRATSADEWTGEYANRIAKEIRRREDKPDLPLYLIGHSGGGQFLLRAAAFVATDAKRIVVANPGTHLIVTHAADYPFGFGGLPDELCTDERLKMFLSQPLTLYLGSKDIERDEHLDVTPPAEAQGSTRYERGQRAFATAKALAQVRGWPFGWKFVVANGVEHDHTKMFNHELCAEALGLNPQKATLESR